MTSVCRSTIPFDNGDVPADGLAEERQIYGPSDALATTVTTPLPGALLKDITQPEAAIGEQFAYRITVPETPGGNGTVWRADSG